MGEVGRSIRRDPGLHLSILWNKLRLTLGPYEVPDNHAIDWDARYVPLLRVPLPDFAVWGWLGLGGLFLAIGSVAARRARCVDAGAAVELALLALLYLGTVVLTVTSDRIRLGLVPLLLAFAGHAPLEIARGLRARAGGRALAAVAALALAAPIAWLHVFPAEVRARDLDERAFNHAVNLLVDDAGLDEAERVARGLSARFPDSGRLAILQAEIEFRRARPLLTDPSSTPEDFRRGLEMADGALERLKPIVRGDGTPPRERHRAQKLAGLILMTAGKPEAAERRLRESLAFDPEDRDVRWWLANTLFAQARGVEGDERARLVGECEQILLGLRAEAPTPELERALADLRALR